MTEEAKSGAGKETTTEDEQDGICEHDQLVRIGRKIDTTDAEPFPTARPLYMCGECGLFFTASSEEQGICFQKLKTDAEGCEAKRAGLSDKECDLPVVGDQGDLYGLCPRHLRMMFKLYPGDSENGSSSEKTQK